MIWLRIGTMLAIGYFTFLYRSSRGKVSLEEGSLSGFKSLLFHIYVRHSIC